MRTQFAVWLDGIGLQDLDPRIYVTDVEEAPLQTKQHLHPRLSSGGMFASPALRQKLTVTVHFLIHESDPIRRKRLLMQVSAWAQRGSTLTVSDRPHQQLHVQAETLPAMASSLKWTDPLSLTFAACAYPWWEEIVPVSLTLLSGETAAMHLPGTSAHVPVSVNAVNTSGGTISSLTLTCGETAPSLGGLAWANGEELLIGPDSLGLMTMTVGGRNAASCRTPQSSDWLLIPCGAPATISVSCERNVAVTVSAKGAWV